MKPTGPRESRGEFEPIATSAPGMDICEHLPRMARWMHKTAIVRSVHREAGCHNGIPTLTGLNGTSQSGNPDFESPLDPPSMGSVCDYVGLGDGRMPAYVHMPHYMGWGEVSIELAPAADSWASGSIRCTPCVNPGSTTRPRIVTRHKLFAVLRSLSICTRKSRSTGSIVGTRC